MTERHGDLNIVRSAPSVTGHQRAARTGKKLPLRWKEARNGVPLGVPYEWNGVPANALPEIRQAAATLCGLAKYPAELIELSESLDAGWGHLPAKERKAKAKRYRRLLLAARREQAASEGGGT